MQRAATETSAAPAAARIGDEVAANSPCDLCGGQRFELIALRDRRGEPLDTAICKRCGLVRHRNLPSEDELRAYYEEHYRREYKGVYEPAAKHVLRAYRSATAVADSLREWLRPGMKVFEVGAGMGMTVRVVADRGFDASGIEPNRGYQRFAQQRLGVNVSHGTLEDCAQAEAFDLVLLLHVIEHLPSPRRAFERIAKLLKPGGLLLVRCPNIGGSFAMRNKLFHRAHVHNFTPATVIALGGRCGFELAHQFAADDDPTLALLLRKTGGALNGGPDIPTNNYAETLAAIRRYNVVTYHLRWGYLSLRIRKLWRYAHETVAAKRFARRMMAGDHHT